VIDDDAEILGGPLLTAAYMLSSFEDARLIKPYRYQGIDWRERPFRSKLVYYAADGPPEHLCRVVVRPRRRDKTVWHERGFRPGAVRWSNLRSDLVFTSIPFVHVEVGSGFRVPWNAALVGWHRGGAQLIIYCFGRSI
jgi:hypothetical protein